MVQPDNHDLCLTAPIDRWDEAVPLGNGILGALLWGDAGGIRVSLDRGDVWVKSLGMPMSSCVFALAETMIRA